MPMSAPASPISRPALAKTLDATKLVFGPDEDPAQAIKALCHLARQYQCRAVCVPPEWVKPSREWLAGSAVMVATVIGFPTAKCLLAQALPVIGHVPLDEKLSTITQVRQAGADELDIVMDVQTFKATQTLAELSACQLEAGPLPIKWIMETDLLTPTEQILVTTLCAHAKIAFVKTSTGMITDGQGATVEVISRLKETLDKLPNSKTAIKASGGVKTIEQALALIEAGASVLGTSATAVLLEACSA